MLRACRRLSQPGRGLLGRTELHSGHGMLSSHVVGAHRFMRFAIDVVFLDADLTVSRSPTVCGRGARRFGGAHQALELPAGESERLWIRVGDRLAWARSSPRVTAAVAWTGPVRSARASPPRSPPRCSPATASARPA